MYIFPINKLRLCTNTVTRNMSSKSPIHLHTSRQKKHTGYAYKDSSKCINQQPMKRDNSIKRHVWINQSMTSTRQNGQKIINKTENYHIKKSTTPGFYLSLSLTVGSTFQLSSDKLLNDMIGTVTSILLQALGENL